MPLVYHAPGRWNLKESSLVGPCRHLGQPTGETVSCATCSRAWKLKLFRCALHDLCTPEQPVAGVACCGTCPDASPATSYPPMEWISTARLVADSVTLAGMLPSDLAGIAGIPRSGMIPASVIATHLHLPLFELAQNGRLVRLGSGSRGWSLPRSGLLAVVDDTVYSGSAMRRARESLGRRPAVYAAVYVAPGGETVADLHVRRTGSAIHLLEWNLLNNGPLVGLAASPLFGRGVALDLDGVICHDEHSGGKVGTPYLPPRAHPCPLICTGRPEAQRAGTEAQLRLWGVRWQRLEMVPGDTMPGWEEVALFKARHYGPSGCGFFIESCPRQAERIWRLTGKPVICPREGRVWA